MDVFRIHKICQNSRRLGFPHATTPVNAGAPEPRGQREQAAPVAQSVRGQHGGSQVAFFDLKLIFVIHIGS